MPWSAAQHTNQLSILFILIAIFLTVISFFLFFFAPSRPLRSDVPDRKLTSDEEEARRIAEMGKPVLGEHSKLEVIIEESYEFKVGKLFRESKRSLIITAETVFACSQTDTLTTSAATLPERTATYI